MISKSHTFFNKEEVELLSPVSVQRRVFLESFAAEVALEIVPNGPGSLSMAIKGQVRSWQV